MSKLTDEWGFFIPMPELVIEKWLEIGTNAIALFLYLRYRTHKNRGVAFPGYEKIREDTGWGYSRVKDAIEILEGAELLHCQKRFGRTTVYTLTVPPDMGVMDTSPTESVIVVDGHRLSPTETVASVLLKQEDVLKTELPKTESKPSRSKNERGEKNVIRKALQEEFMFRTNLKAPPLETQKQRNSAGAAWWAPLREIAELVEWDVERGKRLIARVVKHMRDEKLTIADPRSIVKIARSIVAEGTEKSITGSKEFLNALRRS